MWALSFWSDMQDEIEVAKTKICTKCKKELPFESFSKLSKTKCELRSACKKCSKEYITEYRKTHKLAIAKQRIIHNKCNLEKMRQYRKDRYSKIKEQENKKSRDYYLKNKLSILIKYRQQRAKHYQKNRIAKIQYTKEYRKTHNAEINKASLFRRKNDVGFRMRCNLGSRIRIAVKNQFTTKAKKTMDLLGCSIVELRAHLESKFTTGMNWDNYGKNGWEIDHIIPCVLFDLSKEEEQKECFHWSNLQPLWQKDNSSKNTIRKISLHPS